MNKKITLYTLTGLPYSGKSTLRNELVKRFNFNVISVDEIMDEKDMWRVGHPTQKDWGVAYSEAYNKLKTYLREEKSVIFDGGSLKFKERETQRFIAAEMFAKHKLIYVNTSKSKIIERQLANKLAKVRGQLSKKELETAFNMFEAPNKREKPIIYNHKLNLDTWIETNIKQER